MRCLIEGGAYSDLSVDGAAFVLGNSVIPPNKEIPQAENL